MKRENVSRIKTMDEEIRMEISIPSDDDGYTGRECPECEKYFKVKLGTGIPGAVPCNCPYCGHNGPHDEFWTKEQIEYAQSIALHKISGDFLRELKKLAVKPKRNDFISIGIQIKGSPTPITYYLEKELEQKITCSSCALEYAIYGVFGYCPDCASHNSLQIFEANIELIEKMLKLAERQEKGIQEKLIENSLEDAVSAFDGFGRECCKVFSHKSRVPDQAQKLSFQNINNARNKVKDLFGFDFADNLSSEDWTLTFSQFQKRHLLAHKMGIIDEEHVKKTGVSSSLVGKKVNISHKDVSHLLHCLRELATCLYSGATK